MDNKSKENKEEKSNNKQTIGEWLKQNKERFKRVNPPDYQQATKRALNKSIEGLEELDPNQEMLGKVATAFEKYIRKFDV